MTLPKKLVATLLLFLTVGTASAWAGDGTATSGADFELDGKNPWNLGEAPVEYCIEVNPAFGYSRDTLSKLVSESLGNWKAFFIKYGLDQKKFTGLSDGSARGLSLNFVEVPKCDQPEKQIRMLFGTSDSEIRSVLDSADLAFGLATRHKFDHQTYRNGGIVWVRYRKFSRDALQHVLTHELGHVFGMRHNTVSVMMGNIAEQMISPAKYRDSFGMIETPAWPFRFLPGDMIDYTYNGRHRDASGQRAEPNLLLGAFKDVIEFDKNGFHSLQLHYETGNIGSRFNHRLRLTIRIPESGMTYSMAGDFTFRSNPLRLGLEGVHYGPEVHTRRHCAGCGANGRIERLPLDVREIVLPAEGKFEFAGKIYPALLDQRNGPYLRIFNPETGSWWGVDFYFGASFLEHSP